MTILAPWFLCPHAMARMAEMEVGRAEVVDALEWPEITCRSHPWPRRAAYKGRLRVVYDPVGRFVVTVLWRDHSVTSRS